MMKVASVSSLLRHQEPEGGDAVHEPVRELDAGLDIVADRVAADGADEVRRDQRHIPPAQEAVALLVDGASSVTAAAMSKPAVLFPLRQSLLRAPAPTVSAVTNPTRSAIA